MRHNVAQLCVLKVSMVVDFRNYDFYSFFFQGAYGFDF